MLFADLVPPPAGKSPKEYRSYVEEKILSRIDDVLTVEDFVILYSGPSRTVWQSGLPDVKSNDGLSLQMAKDIAAAEGFDVSRINDTEAAKALNLHKLEKYFTPYFEKEFPSATVGEIEELQNAAYAEVWGGISELFAKRAFRHAATAVCGASPSRVFIKDELPVLVDTDHLKTINGIRFEAIKRIYNEVSPDEAFKLICLSEINFVYSRTHVKNMPEDDVVIDAKRRIAYYKIERDETEPLLDDLTDAQNQALENIKNDFGLNALCATAPETWSSAVKRPLRLSLLVAKSASKTNSPAMA